MQIIQFEIEHFDMMELDPCGFVSRDTRPLFDAYAKVGPAITLINGKMEPVACSGVTLPWNGFGEFWMIPSKLVPQYPISVWKEAKSFIADSIERFNLHRIQATVREEDLKAITWIERLGFAREGLLHCFDQNKANYFIYARLNDV
jgi:hypothetical protein